MKAKILPLKGKYYGTEIEIDTEKNHPYNEITFKIWYSGDGQPSDRELKDVNITRKEWNNKKLEKERVVWETRTTDPSDILEICDSHFESQDCLEIAKKIVKSINKG